MKGGLEGSLDLHHSGSNLISCLGLFNFMHWELGGVSTSSTQLTGCACESVATRETICFCLCGGGFVLRAHTSMCFCLNGPSWLWPGYPPLPPHSHSLSAVVDISHFRGEEGSSGGQEVCGFICHSLSCCLHLMPDT